MNPEESTAESRQSRRVTLSLVCGVIAVLLCACLGGWYGNRAAPGTHVAGQDVSGMNQTQIRDRLDDLTRGFSVPITVGGVTATATAGDLGVAIDSQTAAVRATGSRTVLAFWYRDRIGRSNEVPFTVTVDEATMSNWLDTTFAGQMVSVTEPTLRYDVPTGAFVPVPGSDGSTVGHDALIERLPALLAGSATGPVVLPIVHASPSVTEAQVRSAQQRCETLIATSLTITSIVDNSTLYSVAPAQIASWLTVTPDATVGRLTIGVDEAAIAKFLADDLAPVIADLSPASVVAPSGGTMPVVSTGATRVVLTNASYIADAWYQALTQQIPGSVVGRFDVVASPQQVVTDAVSPPAEQPQAPTPPPVTHNGHWVDVNLTTQTATLYDGETPGQSFVISSGAPDHPTPIGSYQVYAKVPSQTIKGADYRYDDVKWCTWFYGNYGFHTAYWHNDFGTPVSHGCVNMREADAQAVYDWLSITSYVEIHD